MKFYLVKVTSLATEENPYFGGQEYITYHGIKDREIARCGFHAKVVGSVQELSQYMIKKYGYSRMCDAKRNWSYKNPENSEYWESRSEIVEIEIDNYTGVFEEIVLEND